MSRKDENKPKSIIYQLHEICNDICDNYCKYTEKYLPENPDPDSDLDMLEEMLYTEICAKCPLMRIDQVI